MQFIIEASQQQVQLLLLNAAFSHEHELLHVIQLAEMQPLAVLGAEHQSRGDFLHAHNLLRQSFILQAVD